MSPCHFVTGKAQPPYSFVPFTIAITTRGTLQESGRPMFIYSLLYACKRERERERGREREKRKKTRKPTRIGDHCLSMLSHNALFLALQYSPISKFLCFYGIESKHNKNGGGGGSRSPTLFFLGIFCQKWPFNLQKNPSENTDRCSERTFR